MKKFWSILLTAAMSLGMILTAAGVSAVDLPFKDVEHGWYYDAVVAVYEAKAMTGKKVDMFEPFSNMTRAEFVKLLANLSGVDTDEYIGKSTFRDVRPDKWYAGAVAWAESKTLVNGYPGNLFKPENPISREELAKLIIVYLGHNEIYVPENPIVEKFNDADSVQSWAKGYVDTMRLIGLMAGDENGNFLPQKTANRAEVATLVMRLLPYIFSTEINLDFVLGKFAEGVCAYHGYYHFFMGDTDDFTVENLEDAFLAKMGLDLPEYEERYHIVFVNDNEIAAAKEDYAKCKSGAAIVSPLTFKLTDSVERTESETLSLGYRIVKWPEAAGQFTMCQYDADLDEILENIQDNVKIDDAYRLFITLETTSTFSPANIGAQIFDQLGLAPGAYELVFEDMENFESMRFDYEGITHAQAIIGGDFNIAIRDLPVTQQLRDSGELGEDEYYQSEFLPYSFHCEKDLTNYENAKLPEDGTEFAFDGEPGTEEVFANRLLETVRATEGGPAHSKIKIENFEAVKTAYNAIEAGSSATVEVTAVYIIPKETFIDNNLHNFPDLGGVRTYVIKFSK